MENLTTRSLDTADTLRNLEASLHSLCCTFTDFHVTREITGYPAGKSRSYVEVVLDSSEPTEAPGGFNCDVSAARLS